jgi:hypothetical protein
MSTDATYYRMKVDKHSSRDCKVVYAEAGEKVQLISQHGDVLIVQGKKGGFSVCVDDVLPVANTK